MCQSSPRMRGLRAFLLLLALFLAAGSAGASPLCDGEGGRCSLSNGFYFAETPLGWNGRDPLPVLVHFHGFREIAADVIAREDLREIAGRLGFALVVPQGEGQTWSHPGSPSQLRDDVAFAESLLADLRQRLPLDENRLWASGFSQGASMVWAIACARPGLFRFHLPVSGAFWRPEPESCPAGLRAIRHIHGLGDVTFPLEGRPVRGGKFHQGRIRHAIDLARKLGACRPAEEDVSTTLGVLGCRRATGCERRAYLEFCLHAGGHDFDPSWLEDGFRLLPEIGGDSARGR
jgi:polyhydroxybutyrate depolymerase